MADKQVNININYKVNTVEVEKAQALVQKAQATTNQFQQASQQAGKATETAFKAAGASIETINGKLLSLKDRITQSSDPKKVAQLSEQYKKLKTQLDELNKSAFQTPKAIAETGKATQSLTGQLGGLYSAVKLAFTAGIIKEVVTTTLELASLAGNVEGVERAFQRAFPNSVFLLEQLKKATHGTVTEFELMQRTLQATNLGVSVDELGVLFEFAAARAQQTGESVDYLVDSIVRGIGRKSILVLDNLGLSATRLREQFNGASLASLSVGEVTKGVANIAGVELEKMGGYAETSATKVSQLTANVTELRIEVAKKIESSWLIDLFKDSVEGLKMLVKGQKQLDDEFTKSQAAKQVDAFINEKSFKDQEKNAGSQIALIIQEIAERKRLIRVREDEISQATKRRQSINIDNVQQQDTYRKTVLFLKESQASLDTQIDSQKESKSILEESIPILSKYIKQIQNRAALEKDELGIIEQLQEDIETLGDKIKKASSFEDIRRLNDELKLLQATLTEIQNSTNQFNPLASAVYDIEKGAFTKLKLKPGDIINSEDLQKDTEKLFKNMGEKSGEEFELGAANEIKRRTELEQAFEDAKADLINAGIDIAANSLIDLANMEADSYAQRINMLRSYYDDQITLAGDNQRAKEGIQQREKKAIDKARREQAQKEKQAAIFSIIISTAASIAKTAATLGFPAAIPAIIIAAASGAAQLAIASQQRPGFKEGVLNLNGPGTGTSDSINARLSKGESVMTAQEWKTSKNVLKEVRAKRLDDDVLANLKLGNDGVKVVGGMDDKRMIAKLDEIKNSMPDVEARGHLLYTTKKKSDNYRQWVRKSSMSS